MSKIITASLLKMKQDGQKFTAYDATFANKLFDEEGSIRFLSPTCPS